MLNKKAEKIKNIAVEGVHEYLINQIKGYIDIEVGKVACEYGFDIGYISERGLAIYIKDPKYCKKVKDPMEILPGYDENEMYNTLMIGRYHYEDILWLLHNIKNESFKMGLDVRRYARTHDIVSRRVD